MICLECDEQLGKGVSVCPTCGTEYGDINAAQNILETLPVKQEEAPKKIRGRPRTSTESDTPVSKKKPVINVSATVHGNQPDKVIPWNRHDGRFYSIIAPARCPDGAGGWLPFCPATPKKAEKGYSTKSEDVLEWVENVMLGGHQRQCNYTLTAILYFAAKLWSTDRPDLVTPSEYDKVHNLLIDTFLHK